MDINNNSFSYSLSDFIKHDLPSGIVVFLVALPLCMGIALASGAEPIAGLIAGIIGGIVVGLISKANLSVSGPAAGLSVIVLQAIGELNSYEIFLLSVFVAGVIQLLLGLFRVGFIAHYFPNSVIKGMLAGIGVILILKQLPHALGYDVDFIGEMDFLQWDHENTFSELGNAVRQIHVGALLVSIVAIITMIAWPKIIPEKFKAVPAPLIAVVLAIAMNELFGLYMRGILINEEHLINLPITRNINDIKDFIIFPEFSAWNNKQVWLTAVTLALVASLESLLSINAIDKLDPLKRKTPVNRELLAQGSGNVLSSLIGGLPMTAVIVRGAANVNAGAKTKASTILHGILLVMAILVFPSVLNKIPYACLASILIVIGYKLTNVSLFKGMYKLGWEQFTPFLVTIVGVVLTDLMLGIGLGMATAAFFILRRNILNPYTFKKKDDDAGEKIRIALPEEVSFLNKAKLVKRLNNISPNSEVIIDGTKSKYIDDDIYEVIEDFKKTAREKQINLELLGITKSYEVFKFSGSNGNKSALEYEQLLDNNKRWVESRVKSDPDYFKNLAKGQAPKYLFIGCSDSRIPESEIMNTDPGDIFVHRNIANLVVHTDMNLMSVLQYSIEVLKVEHVIVCGHYGCGGVKAAVDHHDHGLIDKWLTNIKDTYRLYYKELEGISNDEDRHKKLVELNVREQVYHLCMTTQVQRAWKSGHNLKIHGWVFDLSSGLINDLGVDIKRDLQQYNLYQFD